HTRRTRNGDVVAVAHYPYNRAHTPSSNLHSNVEDMARWILVNLNHGQINGQQILERSSHDVMLTPAFELPGKKGHVGISWFISEEQGERLIKHPGGDDGFVTIVALVPARNLGIVLMANTDRAPFGNIWDRTLAAVLGK